MHQTILAESSVLQFTTEMFALRTLDFTQLKDMSLGQFICLLFNDENKDKDTVQDANMFEGATDLDCLDQLKGSEEPLKCLSFTPFAF